MKKIFIFGLLIIFALILSGCAISKEDKLSNPALLEPQTALKFQDVPVPVGFKILPQNSYSFENSGVRVGILKYQGKADPDQVVNFYKEQMPMYNWNLLNVVEFGERLMNFDRDNETCVIAIQSKGNSVTITATLGPKSQNLRKKEKQPVKPVK